MDGSICFPVSRHDKREKVADKQKLFILLLTSNRARITVLFVRFCIFIVLTL